MACIIVLCTQKWQDLLEGTTSGKASENFCIKKLGSFCFVGTGQCQRERRITSEHSWSASRGWHTALENFENLRSLKCYVNNILWQNFQINTLSKWSFLYSHIITPLRRPLCVCSHVFYLFYFQTGIEVLTFSNH